MHQSNQTYLLVEITIINAVEMLCCWKREIWPMCLINSCSSGHSSNHLSFTSNLTLWTNYLAQTVKMWWEAFGQWNTPTRWSMTNLDFDSDGNLQAGALPLCLSVTSKSHQARLSTQGFCLDCLYCLYVGIPTYQASAYELDLLHRGNTGSASKIAE